MNFNYFNSEDNYPEHGTHAAQKNYTNQKIKQRKS